MLIGRLFKHPLPQPLCVCVCVCACVHVFYILSVTRCIISAPELPEPLMLAQDPRTKKSTGLFVCKGFCHDNCPTFDPHLHLTSVLRTCCVSVAPAPLPWKGACTHTCTHFRGSLRTESGRGILLILACNLISMPQRHSEGSLSWHDDLRTFMFLF